MNWYHALLFVHVLAAFLAVAGVVMYLGFLTATGSGASAPGQAPLLRLAPLATGLWNVGGLGTKAMYSTLIGSYQPFSGESNVPSFNSTLRSGSTGWPHQLLGTT